LNNGTGCKNRIIFGILILFVCNTAKRRRFTVLIISLLVLLIFGQHQMSYVHEQMSYVHDQMLYVREQMSYVHDQMSYVHDQMSYVHEQMPYVHEQMSCVHEQMSYVHEQMSYVHEQMSYVHEQMSCVHEQMSYVHDQMSCVLVHLLCILMHVWSFWCTRRTSTYASILFKRNIPVIRRVRGCCQNCLKEYVYRKSFARLASSLRSPFSRVMCAYKGWFLIRSMRYESPLLWVSR
jgi:hypothetical protein